VRNACGGAYLQCLKKQKNKIKILFAGGPFAEAGTPAVLSRSKR
jgi:hypothetical protein